jgi:tellurite resistance protein TerC
MDWWVWAAFIAFLAIVIAVDLFFFHRGEGEVSLAEAGWWSALWLALGLGFALVLLPWKGPEPAGEYLAGYAIERALSIDNVFVFALLIGFFAVPAGEQQRVLLWGVVAALVLRAGFIAGGLALLDAFHWMIYVFGALLLVTGVRMATHRTEDVHPERNPVLRAVRRFIPTTDGYRGRSLVVREGGRRLATPLFAVMVAVAITDVVFAVDSIPAVFAVTRHPFIVFTSNAMAVLGLRALYFLLAGMMSRFRYLQTGLAVVLVLVGAKMVLSDVVHLPIWASLAMIGVVLGGAVLLSLVAAGRDPTDGPAPAIPRSMPGRESSVLRPEVPGGRHETESRRR